MNHYFSSHSMSKMQERRMTRQTRLFKEHKSIKKDCLQQTGNHIVTVHVNMPSVFTCCILEENLRRNYFSSPMDSLFKERRVSVWLCLFVSVVVRERKSAIRSCLRGPWSSCAQSLWTHRSSHLRCSQRTLQKTKVRGWLELTVWRYFGYFDLWG